MRNLCRRAPQLVEAPLFVADAIFKHPFQHRVDFKKAS
jgi:hypothetical protein